MKIMNIIQKIALLLVFGILIASCGGGNSKNKINLAYANWAEGIAMTHVAKVVLEEKGYDVNLMNADIAPIFASLSRGNADAFMDVWMPVTHHDYMEQYGESLEVIGVSYDQARIGLVVPSYVPISSIEELNEYKDKFKGEIIGIDAGAGIMKATDAAIPAYELDFNLLTSSGAAMTATLKRAIDNNEWVVVTGWTPHWMFSRFDIKLLDDPKNVYGDAEQIQIVTRKGFSEEQPFVAEFLSNVKFTDEQISSVMATLEDGNNDLQSAKDWVEANRELVNSWLPKEEDSEILAN